MRIGIDARLFGIRERGIGRYVQILLEELQKLHSSQEFFVFLTPSGMKEFHPHNPAFTPIEADILVYGWKEQLLFPKIINRYRIDLMHFPHWNVPLLYRGTFIITVHDLILDALPHIRGVATTRSRLHFGAKFLFYRLNNILNFRHARHIITLTNSTKTDLMRYYHVPVRKISVIPNGLSVLPTPTYDKALLSRYNISVPYLLYVGAFYPHKNLPRLLEAFKNLALPDLSLACVGRQDPFAERLKKYCAKLGINKRVRFLHEVDDSALSDIYAQAQAYVFPSLSEGFGLTPLEAMQAGVPVLASRTSCLPEVLGNAALFCDPYSVPDMTAQIQHLLTDKKLRETLIARGYTRIRNYSWQNTAQNTFNLYIKTEV